MMCKQLTSEQKVHNFHITSSKELYYDRDCVLNRGQRINLFTARSFLQFIVVVLQLLVELR